MRNNSAFGNASVTFRIKDWGISRQRYWGTPIPVIHCPACGVVPVPRKSTAGDLAGAHRYHRHGPLAARKRARFRQRDLSHPAARRRGARPIPWTRLSDSSWYFYRYCDAHNNQMPFDPAKIAYWFEIDQYIGGVEHAILHLIYSRFFTK